MKLLFFDDFVPGVLGNDGTVVDTTSIVGGIPHNQPQELLNELISRWDEFKPKLQEAAQRGGGKQVSQVRLRSPLPAPVMTCMAVNYMENGTRAEPAPINSFMKAPHTAIGDGDTMILPDIPASVFEGEAELAAVIGKPGVDIKEADAMPYIFGYVNFIDGSARAMTPYWQMKSRTTFAPMGPYLVTADEIADPLNLQVKLWNNGVLKQDYHTSDMAHKIARCIEWVSSVQPIRPGDLIALGTNHRGLHPFQDGDKVEMEIEGGLGRITISVQDDLKRVWPRETHLERETAGLPGGATQTSGKYAPAATPAS